MVDPKPTPNRIVTYRSGLPQAPDCPAIIARVSGSDEDQDRGVVDLFIFNITFDTPQRRLRVPYAFPEPGMGTEATPETWRWPERTEAPA